MSKTQTTSNNNNGAAAAANSTALDWKFQQVFGDAKSEEAVEGALHMVQL